MPYTPANVFTKKKIKCEYEDCKSSFSSVSSRKTHYKNKHKNQAIRKTKDGKVIKKKKSKKITDKQHSKKVNLAIQQEAQE